VGASSKNLFRGFGGFPPSELTARSSELVGKDYKKREEKKKVRVT
jgi:hypothetical protein